MTNIIFSTDVDVLQSSLVVTDANTDLESNCHYLEEREDGKFDVYSFDLLSSLNDWYSLNEIEDYTGLNYGGISLDERDVNYWANFTADVCSYYGAGNLDSYPRKMKAKKVERWIKK
tara:strand:- start:114 stop:464 length:351 start_codon:yes stop_codon:yes gene_type:complete